jgi:hypothetical protein
MPGAIVPLPSRVAVLAVAVLGAVNLSRGAIHLFAPDGGAASIAGLDLSGAPQTILFLFAALGAGQISFGLVDLAAAARYQGFVRPLIVIHAVQGALTALVFAMKPPPVLVPGQMFNLVLFALVLAVCAYEFARRESAPRENGRSSGI